MSSNGKREITNQGCNSQGNQYTSYKDGSYYYSNNKTDSNTGQSYKTSYYAPTGNNSQTSFYRDNHTGNSWYRNSFGDKKYY